MTYNMKFSISVPTPVEPVRPIYGYKRDGMVYWQTRSDSWYYFNLCTGATFVASSNNDYNDSSKFEPIYEPFSINIGF